MERLGSAALRWSSSQRSNPAQRSAGIRYVVRINLGCWKRFSFSVSPVHSAAPTASTDLSRSPSVGWPQLRVDAPLQIANPAPNGRIGAEQPAGEKHRVGRPQLFGVILGLLAQAGIRRVLELLVAEQPRFQRAEDARAEPLEILVETPALQLLDLPRARASGV